MYVQYMSIKTNNSSARHITHSPRRVLKTVNKAGEESDNENSVFMPQIENRVHLRPQIPQKIDHKGYINSFTNTVPYSV